MSLLACTWTVERTWGRAIRFVLEDPVYLQRG
jgi:hypothetical protein